MGAGDSRGLAPRVAEPGRSGMLESTLAENGGDRVAVSADHFGSRPDGATAPHRPREIEEE